MKLALSFRMDHMPVALPAAPSATIDPEPLDIGGFLRDIGRGREGARSLDAARARTLFDAILAGRVGELETGGVLIALRMKGESVDELEGALAAAHDWLEPVPVDASRPAVAIPSYNGARNQANLTALLACLLADAGVQVVVHGVLEDPKRTTTAQVMRALGLGGCASAAEARRAIGRREPAFVPIDALSPRLAALLAMRWRLGVRNVGHTLVKLLNPTDSPACLRICAYTHPEFNLLQHALFERTGAPALILRGTEGEVVAGTRRVPQIDWMHDGVCEPLVPAQTTPMGAAPDLPPAHDAGATAVWIRSVLAGERAVPEAIARQVQAVLRATGAERAVPA